ncbi:MAG: apolipoprotein N-acyltransferase [Rhodospirillaceae bacterium]|nr:apolipoprotein N-acyltransferase [Rhodospirillaceae bacterium]
MPWQRALLAALLGAASTLAMPPWHVVPLLWVTVPLLLWMLDSCKTARSAMVIGWSFGFGHFAVGLNWIANAFYVDADTHGAFAIPAVAGLCAIFGVYIAVVTLIVHRLPRAPRYVRAFGFALAWMSVEWVRGWLFTGFPWNPMGSVWAAWPEMIQITTLFGTLGLGLFTLIAAAAVFVFTAPATTKHERIFGLAPTALLIVFGLYGAVRLYDRDVPMVPDVNLRLVQPNIAQADKWRPGLREQHFMDHVRLSASTGVEGVTHVIWGEAAVAFALDRDEVRRAIAVSMLSPGATLITGVPRVATGANGIEEIFNSMLVVRSDASVAALYDKTHLVPFGEYLPLRGLIPFRKLTEGTMDFSAGHGRTTLSIDNAPPFSPLICYEAIFSGEVTGPPTADGQRPQWLLNITNDSWFGDTSGPRQHLAEAQLRAVEEGLPLIRVANTGISAVIDPYGRVLGRIALNTRGTLDSPLPQAAEGRTLFSRTGQWGPIVLILLGIVFLWEAERRRRAAAQHFFDTI